MAETRYKISHTSVYKYHGTARYGRNLACLIPRTNGRQRRECHQLLITPAPIHYSERVDVFGNLVSHFAVEQHHSELRVNAVSEVTVLPDDAAPWEASLTVGQALAKLQEPVFQTLELLQYVAPSPALQPASERLWRWAARSFKAHRPLREALQEFNSRLYEHFEYRPSSTDIDTTPNDAFDAGTGVCQDFTNVAIAALRRLGFPVAYISGYLETRPPPGKKKLVGADASHAWFSVFVPEYGWQDFDPTNNTRPAQQHIMVARGRDYTDVTPLKGIVFGGHTATLEVAVDVTPIAIAETTR